MRTFFEPCLAQSKITIFKVHRFQGGVFTSWAFKNFDGRKFFRIKFIRLNSELHASPLVLISGGHQQTPLPFASF